MTEERYRLGRTIGQGGMATIVEAEDGNLNRVVAIKQLRSDMAEDERTRARFRDEAEIMASLHHPGVVPVHERGVTSDGTHYYAMEKIGGPTLQDLIDKAREARTRRWTVPMDLVDVFRHVCETVGFAHARDLIHRDLKPENVMVDEFGAVYVMDWGVAKRVGDARDAESSTERTVAGAVLGTPAYMSPEVAGGMASTADRQSDVFALGVILYEILTGERPFRGETMSEALKEVLYHDPEPPKKRNRRVGHQLSAICMKALAKDPRQRYRTAGELADDVTRHRQFLPVRAAPPRFWGRVWSWAGRNPRLGASLATLVLVGLAGSALFAVQHLLDDRLYDRTMEQVAQHRATEAALTQTIGELEKRRDELAEGSPERRTLSRRLEEARARRRMARGDLVGAMRTAAGLAFLAPEDEFLDEVRTEMRRLISDALHEGRYYEVKAFIETRLESDWRKQFFEFPLSDLQFLEEALAEANRGIERTAGGD